MKSSCHFLQLPIPKTRLSSLPTTVLCSYNNCQLSLSLMLRLTVSRPVCLGIKDPSGTYDQILIFVWQLRVCRFGAPCLTRGRVCRLQLLLVLASAVIFGTCGHILLSQIRDFPFRRLLRLAGSRWRYSTPPPHGLTASFGIRLYYNHFARTQRKTQPVLLTKHVYEPLPSNSHIRHNIYNQRTP
jgi:hypothetical protein